ncbi:neogenin [Patella vulgata]|uniref:neogenin n=1 Tax=Patella vulgata TaxID=6465 RepID=UPI0024A84699|nr:neogenin [Patella vulgata]
MAKNYLYWCSIAAVFILITDLLGVLCLPTKLPQIEGLDPGIVIIEQPNDPIIAIKKSSVLINCSVISSSEHGQVHYFWKKDGIRLNNKKHRSRLEIMRNGSLHIRRVIHKGKGNMRTDEGFYECFARNNVGTVIGRRVELKVTRIAKEFTESPVSQAVGVGGVVYLACEIEAVPETLYVWQKDNEPLNTNHVRFRQYKNALLITNVQASDVGTYKCFAAIKALLRMDASSSQLRWRFTDEAVVNITQAKTFLPLKIWRKPQTNITVMVNGSTIIDCVVSSQPLPQVRWTWNGQQIPQRAAILSDGSLSLSQISTKMAGNYECLAKVAGHDDKYTLLGVTELFVEVIAHYYPAITLGPASSAHKIARHNILKCEVTGYPKPRVTWLKNGMVVQPDGRHEVIFSSSS